MKSIQSNEFELIAPTFTPMSLDGSVLLGPIEQYCRYLSNQHIDSVFVNGSTGESLSLTVDERKLLAEEWIRLSQSNLRVIAHVGHNCLPDAQELARHAESNGADAIAAMAPTFFRPSSVEELVDFLKPIADAAPNTPFYFYHMPALTGVYIDIESLLVKATRRIKTLAGMKYTHHNLAEFGNITAKWGKKLKFYYGSETQLLPALPFNASGSIGTSFNLIPGLFQALITAWKDHELELAGQLQWKANQYISNLEKFGLLTFGKRILSQLIDADCGEVRLPLPISSDSALEECLRFAGDERFSNECHTPHGIPLMASLTRNKSKRNVTVRK